MIYSTKKGNTIWNIEHADDAVITKNCEGWEVCINYIKQQKLSSYDKTKTIYFENTTNLYKKCSLNNVSQNI